ncbi:MAG: penicillin-binding protein 1A [Gammaproteobacteria bacterium]|nr:penicillin-binding protein 1A [Gammaproteobacteria bacterium]
MKPSRPPRRLVRIALYALLGAVALAVLGLAVAYIYIAPTLPPVSTLQDFELQVPLRVYTRDEKLIAEFGDKKRTPIDYKDVPDLMIKAILAAEDDRFFHHPGVDYQGILRAALNLARTGEKSQGGSTITMQVARNFFLSSEKTYLRKVSEIMLSLKIEHELTKQQILELYLNKIYLGNRAYGIGAAAQVYYGIPVSQLSLAQMAMIAGLPKAPSRYNPIAGPDRALTRRNYIIDRMLQLGYIDQTSHDQAIATPDTASLHQLNSEVEATYVAEMVRATLVSMYEDKAYTSGYRVYTTLDSRLQNAATAALRNALYDYDRRHGYRGPVQHQNLQTLLGSADGLAVLNNIPQYADQIPAIVIGLADQSATVMLRNRSQVDLPWDGLNWARQYINDNALGPELQTASEALKIGDIVYVRPTQGGSWALTQIPEVEGALVSLNPNNGAIVALSGGFDFFHSKFNRAAQAERQPGSSIKPFIYSAALAKGLTTATVINDAPIVFDDPSLENAWRPENYGGEFGGATRLRVALMHSRNLVSIRVLQAIGIDYAIRHLARFGFDAAKLPRNLSLALGNASMTPLELAAGYTVFANGGYRVKPFFITRITDLSGKTFLTTNPTTVCRSCTDTELDEASITASTASDNGDKASPTAPAPARAPRVLAADNVYLMTSMMQDVIRGGTGRRASQLGRNDIAGKTGTTNDQNDAWFAGFSPDYVTVSWVGFDKVRPLGNSETGGQAALPMWIDYMRAALSGLPDRPLTRPANVVSVRIDPETGLLAGPQTRNGIFEMFIKDTVPKQRAGDSAPARDGGSQSSDAPEQLF